MRLVPPRKHTPRLIIVGIAVIIAVCALTMMKPWKVGYQNDQDTDEPPPASETTQPDWYTAPPPDSVGIWYSVGSAVSRDKQIALDKATMAARLEMAQRVSMSVTTTTDDVSSHSKGTVSMTLAGTKVDRVHIVNMGDQYTAYVLLAMPVSE